MYDGDVRVVKPNATLGIPPKAEFLGVDTEGGDHCVFALNTLLELLESEALEEAQGAIFANLNESGGVHDGR